MSAPDARIMQAVERLADAISGERRDWHAVEVRPDDIAALLGALPDSDDDDPSLGLIDEVCTYPLEAEWDEGRYSVNRCGDPAVVIEDDEARCVEHRTWLSLEGLPEFNGAFG